MDIVHGDLKADNVLLSPTGSVVVADFGFSRLMDASMIFAPSSGSLKGTTRWMAFEFFKLDYPQEKSTKESDIWALGMTIYELLTRKLPYHEFHRDAQVINAISKEKLPSAPPGISDRPALDLGLWEICHKQCWSFEPASRPTMEELYTTILECDHDVVQ